MASCRIFTQRPLKIQDVLLHFRQGYATSAAHQPEPADPRPPEVAAQDRTANNPTSLSPQNDPQLFRGILGRAGVKVAVPVGNQYKPDPLLRQQLTAENQYEVLAQTMTPLSHIPYEDQLKFKWERNKKLVVNISRTLSKHIPMLYVDQDGLMCPVDPVVPSPLLTHFRNKDEFSVSTGIDGYSRRVGFYVGRSREGNVVCVAPRELINMKPSHRLLGEMFEKFLEMSPYDSCRQGPAGFVGHWKSITARSNRAGDLMASVIIHPQSLSAEELTTEKNRLVEFFVNGPGKECNLKSLYFQECRHSQCPPLLAPYQLLYGESHLYEHIGKLKFRISPSAFFQLNTEAAEKLYEKIAEVIKPDLNSVLMDVCCGTGTIGLSLAKRFDKVLGVEQDLVAVDDANYNAKANEIRNADFYCDAAEKAIPRLLKRKEFTYTNVSAVVNPSRSGLSVKVINALRKTPQVDRVIYVSCMPIGNAMRNILDLCLPTERALPGENFFPVRAVPVDLFPHTDHCELIVVLERNRVYYV
ncbi:hypothetical protein RvY_02310 [Ramazzottius varieornatus]|uniref:tRNA (uracil(54)-C(5))-methyltransferase n=1 Tax=Ramazzottius varieornatus TaxID=947166 RepID=A0A1D1UK22_RAMVA|nr:hypothetical protein RvY_02310 [Ramazzottius varieornatus]